MTSALGGSKVKAVMAALLLALPVSAAPALARPVTAAQLSAAPYGRAPIRSNRPEWEAYHGNQPGGSPWSGVLGYSGAVRAVGPYGSQAELGRPVRP